MTKKPNIPMKNPKINTTLTQFLVRSKCSIEFLVPIKKIDFLFYHYAINCIFTKNNQKNFFDHEVKY